MKRIATANRAIDLFVVGKDGFRAAVPGVSDATYLSALWFNHVQEAIVRVIEKAGLALSDVDFDQFVTALSTIYVTKPATDTSYTNIAAPVALPASVLGKIVPLGGASAQTVTLPSTAGVPDGTPITLYSQNPGNGVVYTLSAQANQNIVITAAFAQTTTLAPGDSITLVASGGNWLMSGGGTGVALSRMAAFAASKSSSGYQKLPSGLIIQWGQFIQSDTGVAVPYNIALPIAFPTIAVQAIITVGSAIAGGAINYSIEGLSATNMSGFTNSPAASRLYRYFVIGY